MYSFDYGVFHLIFCCKIVSCVTLSFLGNSPLIWFYHNLFILIQLWLKMLKHVFLFHLLVYLYFVYAYVLAAAYCESRRTTWFSFQYRGPRDGTQVLRFGSRYLYPLSYLTGLQYFFWCCINLDMCLNAWVWFCLAILYV